MPRPRGTGFVRLKWSPGSFGRRVVGVGLGRPHPTLYHRRRERGRARDAGGSCPLSRAPAWERVGVRATRAARKLLKSEDDLLPGFVRANARRVRSDERSPGSFVQISRVRREACSTAPRAWVAATWHRYAI